MVQCYAPTNEASDKDLEDFYSALQDTLDKIPNLDIKIVMGDMKSRNSNKTHKSFWNFWIGKQR